MSIRKIIKKYSTFIKYSVSSGISFILDIALFSLLSSILRLKLESFSIIIATILARIISSTFNYLMNRNRVFAKKQDNKFDRNSFFKYFILVVVQMLNSSLLVYYIYKSIHINETLIKIPVECLLFIINFLIQKYFIFNDKKISISTKNYPVLYILMSLITSFAFFIKLDLSKIILMTRHDNNMFLISIFAVFIYFYYKKYYNNTKRRTPFKILSIIFSLLLIFGYSFDLTDSSKLVFGNNLFLLISCLKFVGYYIFFNLTLNVVYDFLKTLKIKKSKNKIVKLFYDNPFLFGFIGLLICYLPYLIAYYPGVIGYDPANQIKEYLGIHNRYMDSVNLISPDVTITNFNPVIHTIFLGSCFKIGLNLGNVNIGIFIYTIIQTILFITVLSYTLSFLKKEGVNNKILFIIFLLYAFVPIFPFYSISTNKDTFFCMLVLLYIISIYKIIKYDLKFKDYFLICVICILLFLSRNNGIHTIMLSLPFGIIFFKDKRWKILCLTLVILFSYMCYSKAILPYFKITPTSIRETLSVPFQQTAALIKYKENILSEKDKKIINEILDYKIIKNKYNPELADKVKNTFNKNATPENIENYFRVWFKYLLKEPKIYVDSTINNVYGYFYPDTNRWYLYYKYNTKLKEAGFNYHYNNLSVLRNILSNYGNTYQYIPILGLTVNIGFTVWIYMYLCFILIIEKRKKYIFLLMPALVLILVCIASPANAYFRYALPYIMSLPVTLCLLNKLKDE